MDTANLTRSQAPWLAGKGLAALAGALAEVPFRVTGGAVRDALTGAGERVDDLDLAAACDVAEAAARCGDAGLAVERHPFMPEVLFVDLPGGLRDPRHAGMRCIGADAGGFARDMLRRDFTVNALCCDASGRVEDHVGGLRDASARRIRFVRPEAPAEDTVRLLRYFRMRVKVGEAVPDPDTLAIVTASAPSLRSAPGVRLAREATLLCDTLGADDFLDALGLMASSGILAALAPLADPDRVTRFVREAEGPCPDVWGRMAVLGLAGDPHVAWGDWRDGMMAIKAEALRLADDDLSFRTFHRAYHEAIVAGDRREPEAAPAA